MKQTTRRTTKLYNLILPIWAIMLFPNFLWVLILPLNFLIDSLVICIAKRVRKIKPERRLWQSSIVKVWLFGFLSDFVGAGFVLLMELLCERFLPSFDTSRFPGLTLITIPGVIIAGLLIYFLNYKFSFHRCKLERKDVKAIALSLAVFTAPYTMLIPVLF